MKIETLGLLALLLLATTVFSSARRAAEPQSCRSRSDVAGKCFNVHGRLSVYNGTPSIRLWPAGTRRLLGVIDPNDTSNAPGPSVLPLDIKSKLDWDKDVFGDFLVCPLTKAQPGHMQTVCLESGRNLSIHPHKLSAH
ncbi:MAG TPA: hypothetical protein VE961_01455 [Pyrinomonadaceae bacterium]|nr:hypothetical protein [Pyrinomonadaceae bacterium]